MSNPSIPDTNEDPFDLGRFVKAQEGVYQEALDELRRGRKESHWMWFIFPQFEGLGSSSTARFYAIKSIEEAKAYLNHSLLGERLLRCSGALLDLEGRTAAEIFGYPDDLKLRSCMTLFANISERDSAFSRVVGRYYGGHPDPRTLELVRERS